MISYKITVQNQEEYDAKISSNPDVCKIHHRSGTCNGDPECSLHHLQLEKPTTIVIKNFFRHQIDNNKTADKVSSAAAGQEIQQIPTDDNNSAEIGVKEKQLNDDYFKFYDDLIAKLRAAGPITTFKCCANSVENLQGNVYVSYENHMYASLALTMYDDFYCNGRPMKVEFSPVVDWKRSVCPQYSAEGNCPRGNVCTFLHVMSNPRDEYNDFGAEPEMMYPQTYSKIMASTVKDEKPDLSQAPWLNRNVAPVAVDRTKRLSLNERNGSEGKTGGTTNSNVRVKTMDNGESNSDAEHYYRTLEVQKLDENECTFFAKVKCCKFGPGCNKYHRPAQDDSTLLLIKNFFDHPRLRIGPDDYKEFEGSSEEELQEAYAKFYDDVLGKFSTIGEIKMFRCCRNTSEHLRGTLYIQYADREAAVEAINMFSGTMYGKRKLIVEFIPKINWKAAICGVYAEKRCPRENECNYLHVFRNPNEYRRYESNDPTSRLCKSYSFSGVCAFPHRCTQQHPVPGKSKLVLVPNFFQHPKLDKESVLDADTFEVYKKFYKDFIEIFRGVGPVLMCKCLLNRSEYLRGNFYVQYSSHDHATRAVKLLASQDVDAQLCYQIDWPKVLCVDYELRRGCKIGGMCNFLHAFHNPRGEYDKRDPFPSDKDPYSRENRSSFRKEARKDDDTRKIDDDKRKSDGGRKSDDRRDDDTRKIDNDKRKSEGGRKTDDSRKSDSDRRKRDDDRRGDDGSRRSDNDRRKSDTGRGDRDQKRRHSYTKSPNKEFKPIDESDSDRKKRDDDRRRDDSRRKSDNDRRESDTGRGDRDRKRRHSYTKSPNKEFKPIDDNEEYIVHVTKLPRKLESDDVRKLFSAYEGMKDVDIPEKSSGSLNLFSAFLVFENKAKAEKVLKAVHTVDGELLRLDGFSALGDSAKECDRSSPARKEPRSYRRTRNRRSRSSSRGSSPSRRSSSLKSPRAK